MSTILSVQNIEKYYGNKGNVTKAVDQISFDVSEGEYVGIRPHLHRRKRHYNPQFQKPFPLPPGAARLYFSGL